MLDAPEIPDEAYDALFRELSDLETTYPELAAPDSPTQSVGAPASSAFAKVRHDTPMLSLENVFDSGEMQAFDRRLAEHLPAGTEREYSAEPKLDGVALSLLYRHGRLVRAASRGDGRIGEDVTHTARTIRSIPARLAGVDAPERLDVRGEVFMPLSEFDAYNRRATDEGRKALVNPRNAAAGALRQKDPALAAQRNLAFFAHGVGDTGDVPEISRQADLLRAIERWGIRVCAEIEAVAGAAECARYFERMAAQRETFDYALDGVVYKLQRFDLRDRAGSSSHAPRWAVAHKFPAEEKLATVSAVEYQVGRTGALTPVARLEPVFVGGATVRNATLHNYREMLRKDVRVGDTVVVRRAGDVIPEVVRPLPERRTAQSPAAAPALPRHCPECGSAVDYAESEPTARCTGQLVCPAQRRARILHFASRSAMNIEGLGEQRVEQLLAAGLVRDLPDIFRLQRHADGLANLTSEEPVGTRAARELRDAIDRSRQTTLERFLHALDIPGIGPKTARRLAERFGGLIPLASASAARLQAADGVGATAAENIHAFFREDRHRKTIAGLLDAGVNWPGEAIGKGLPALPPNRQSAATDDLEPAQEPAAGDTPERLKAAIRRLADRNSLAIRPMGFDWIDQVVDRGFVTAVHDIFCLDQQRLEALTLRRTLGRKSAQNLLEGIGKAGQTTLERFLHGLGIRDVGRVTAEALARHFGSLDALRAADDERLRQAPDVGEVVSQRVREFFANRDNLAMIRSLRANGVQWSERDARTEAPVEALHGASFVLTGTLAGMTRNSARQRIRAMGGRVTGNVSKKTDYLIAGQQPGSKLAMARQLGVRVLDEAGFLNLIDSSAGGGGGGTR